MRVSKVQRSR